MNRKPVTLMILFAILVLTFLSACGGGDEDTSADGDADTGPVQGDVFLTAEDEATNFHAPALFKNIDSEDIIVWRSETQIFYKNLTYDTAIKTISMEGLSSATYGVNHYAVNGNYFVWNSNTPQTYRYQFATDVTAKAQTGSLAPGYCIMTDRLGNESFVAVQPGGYMYQLRLAKFTDTQEISNKITLLDPDLNSEPISVRAFACKQQYGYVATTDGRLFEVNLFDNTPSLGAPLVTGEQFDLLQVDPPYIIWLDQNGDIKMYNLDARSGATLAINVDPIQRSTSRVSDLRLFGSVVVWSDDSEGSYDIWAADLATMENENDYRQITNNSADQSFPFIFDGKLYWEDNRNDLSEIWMSDMPSLSPVATEETTE
jgi:hypothetical protein